MTAPTPTRLFWRVMNNGYVHSTWGTPAEAQRMADDLNGDFGGREQFTVEAWS